MSYVRTVFLLDGWPVSIHLDEWACIGTGKADSLSSGPAEPTSRADSPHLKYRIDVYRWDERHVVAGLRTGNDPRAHHNTGRVLEGLGGVVSAIRGVAEELTVDAEVRRVLIQAVLESLPPVRLRGDA